MPEATQRSGYQRPSSGLTRNETSHNHDPRRHRAITHSDAQDDNRPRLEEDGTTEMSVCRINQWFCAFHQETQLRRFSNKASVGKEPTQLGPSNRMHNRGLAECKTCRRKTYERASVTASTTRYSRVLKQTRLLHPHGRLPDEEVQIGQQALLFSDIKPAEGADGLVDSLASEHGLTY